MVTRTQAWLRGLIIVALAVLTPIGAAIEAGKPIDTNVWVAAVIAGLIALRGFLDISLARVDKSQ